MTAPAVAPTNAPPQNTAPTSPSPAAPGSAPSAPPPSAPTEFRYPADDPNIPAWARGKTASEVVGIGQQLYTTLERTIAGQQPPRPAAPAPQAAPQIGADDFLTAGQLSAYAPQLIQQHVNPTLQRMVETNAQNTLAFVRQKHAETFQKYGPEVHAYLANVDKADWNVETLEKVVRLVRADHVEDIASEIATRRLSEAEVAWRSSGAALPSVPQSNPSNSLQSEKIPSDWKARAEKAGITERTVLEFCQANDMTPDSFFAQFERTVIPEVTRKG